MHHVLKIVYCGTGMLIFTQRFRNEQGNYRKSVNKEAYSGRKGLCFSFLTVNCIKDIAQGLDRFFRSFQPFLEVKNGLFRNEGAAAVTHGTYSMEDVKGTYDPNDLLPFP
jgi:hypothetical protein